MRRQLFIPYIFFFVFVFAGIGLSQIPDTSSVPATSPGSSDFVDLSGEAVIIKVEPERPRVNIIADRIKPEFDTINLDKSFAQELMGRGEKIIIVDQNQGEAFKTIDINKILDKSR